MALPTPQYPANAWDGNEQDKTNDTAADATVANAADHDEIAAEAKAVQDDLRLAMTAGGTAQSGGIEALIKSLRPSYGQVLIVSGTQSVGTGWAKATGTIDGNSLGSTFAAWSADKLTIGADGTGLYTVAYSYSVTAPAAAWQMEFSIYKNGVQLVETISIQELATSGKVYHVTHHVLALAPFAAADYIEIYHRGTNAQTVSITGGLQLYRVAS